jgi:hypothetical protein
MEKVLVRRAGEKERRLCSEIIQASKQVDKKDVAMPESTRPMARSAKEG